MKTKKILLIIHGLVRPDLMSVIDVKDHLKNNFTEYECESLLSTWVNDKSYDQDNMKYQVDIREIKNHFDFYLIDKQPTKEEILSQIRIPPYLDTTKNSHLSNIYGYYHFYKKMILISNIFDNFDYYVFCRSDLDIRVEIKNLNHFMVPRLFWKYGGYSLELNDHFFISDRESFIKIFNKLTLEKISDISSKSDSPEKIFTQIVRENIEPVIIEDFKIKEYYIRRSYRKWPIGEVDSLGRDSTQISIDHQLRLNRK